MIYGKLHGAVTSEYSIEMMNQLFSKLLQLHDIMIFSVEKGDRRDTGKMDDT